MQGITLIYESGEVNHHIVITEETLKSHNPEDFRFYIEYLAEVRDQLDADIRGIELLAGSLDHLKDI